MIISFDLETAKFWMMAIPATIERCQDWRHNLDCERAAICCGKGRIRLGFLEVEEWASLPPLVTGYIRNFPLKFYLISLHFILNSNLTLCYDTPPIIFQNVLILDKKESTQIIVEILYSIL